MRLSNKDLRLMFEKERNEQGISGGKITTKKEQAFWIVLIFACSTYMFLAMLGTEADAHESKCDCNSAAEAMARIHEDMFLYIYGTDADREHLNLQPVVR